MDKSMKALKYFFVGLLMIGFGSPVLAQDDRKAVIDQLNQVIKSKSPDTESQVKSLFKEYKKDPVVMVAIGRAYLDIKDLDNAQKYAEMAIKRDKTCGDAYVLAGDIQVVKDDGGAASAYFEQATMFDPKNPNGYRRYAQVNSKASPTAAVAKLEELRAQVPDYPVDLIAADIYYKAGSLDKAADYYSKVDKSKMEDYQLASYSLCHFLRGNFDKSFEVSKFGTDRSPRYAGLNRLSFYNLTNLKRYDEALTYADALFNRSDSAKITESDYLYYGYAYLGKKSYDQAIEMFQKSLDNNPDNVTDRNDALKNISEAYRQKGDYPMAISSYQNYLNVLENKTALDLNTLATLYMAEASDSIRTEAEKIEYYKKADAVYAEMAESFPAVAEFSSLQRAHIGFALDPETKDGAAKPHYEKLIEILLNKTTKADTDNARLIEAYRYLGYYYLLQEDMENSNLYWNKILEIDPNNETAKQALSATK